MSGPRATRGREGDSVDALVVEIQRGGNRRSGEGLGWTEYGKQVPTKHVIVLIYSRRRRTTEYGIAGPYRHPRRSSKSLKKKKKKAHSGGDCGRKPRRKARISEFGRGVWNRKARPSGMPTMGEGARAGVAGGLTRRWKERRGRRGGNVVGGRLWERVYRADGGRSGPLVTNGAICRHALRPTKASGALRITLCRVGGRRKGTVCLTMEHWRGHRPSFRTSGDERARSSTGVRGRVDRDPASERASAAGPGCDGWAAATWRMLAFPLAWIVGLGLDGPMLARLVTAEGSQSNNGTTRPDATRVASRNIHEGNIQEAAEKFCRVTGA